MISIVYNELYNCDIKLAITHHEMLRLLHSLLYNILGVLKFLMENPLSVRRQACAQTFEKTSMCTNFETRVSFLVIWGGDQLWHITIIWNFTQAAQYVL